MNGYRAAAGVGLVLVFAAAAGRDVTRTLDTWRGWPPPGVVEDASAFDRSCDRVRADLPPRGVVGFRDLSRNKLRDGIPDRRYALTQYALTPLLVDRTADHPVVVELAGWDVRVVRPGGR